MAKYTWLSIQTINHWLLGMEFQCDLLHKLVTHSNIAMNIQSRTVIYLGKPRMGHYSGGDVNKESPVISALGQGLVPLERDSKEPVVQQRGWFEGIGVGMYKTRPYPPTRLGPSL